MASGRKVAEVFVEVRANLSKLKSGMKSAMSIASGGASVIGKVLGGLASLIKNVLTAAFKVVGAVIKTIFKLVTTLFSSIIKWAKRGVLALSAFVALSVVVGAKFGQSMSRVKALTGATTQEFQALREEAKRLGKATEFSANQAADAMSIFAMAGFKTKDVITAMAPTLDFAAASGLDLASAADIAARVMGGMQLKAEDLEHTMDVLTKAFTSANMDATDLGEAMKFVGAVGRTVGKDVEEIVGSLTALAAAGNRGSMAGTGLRKVLMGLATSKVQKKMEKLGVSVVDASGSMKPMSKLIGDLVKATKHLSEMEIADLGVQMFGARGGVAFLQLIGQGEEAIKKYTEQLANVDGFTRKIAATQRDTLATSFKIVQSAIADVMITITDILEPALRSAADRQVKLWNKIGGVLEKNKDRIQNFIKDAITWIKTKLPQAIDTAIGALAELWESMSQTFNNIKSLVVDTTSEAGAALLDFVRFDETTGSTFERVLSAIVIAIVRIGQEVRNLFEDIASGIRGLPMSLSGKVTEWTGRVLQSVFPEGSIGHQRGGTMMWKGQLAAGMGMPTGMVGAGSRAERDEAAIDDLVTTLNQYFGKRETQKDWEERGREIRTSVLGKSAAEPKMTLAIAEANELKEITESLRAMVEIAKQNLIQKGTQIDRVIEMEDTDPEEKTKLIGELVAREAQELEGYTELEARKEELLNNVKHRKSMEAVDKRANMRLLEMAKENIARLEKEFESFSEYQALGYQMRRGAKEELSDELAENVGLKVRMEQALGLRKVRKLEEEKPDEKPFKPWRKSNKQRAAEARQMQQDLAPKGTLMPAVMATITTVLGTAKVGISEQLVFARETATNTRRTARVLEQLKDQEGGMTT